MDHAFGQFDPPPQSAGERLGTFAGPIAQAEPIEHFILPAGKLLAVKSVQMSLMTDVFGDGELLVEAGRLKHDSDSLADGLSLASQVKGENLDPALLERNQRRQQAKQRGLTAAVGSEKGEDFTPLDRQVQVVDRQPLAVMVDETVDLNGGRSAHKRR